MGSQQKMIPEQVADWLIGMGYFRFLPESESEVARQELVSSLGHGYLGTEWDEHCVSRDRRNYPADGEELAEGRTGEFILLMRDGLSHEGVQLHSVEDKVRDEGYDVVIDGQVYPIFNAEAMATYGGWHIATKRFLEIVNDLLHASRSGERLYGIYGGNDGRAVLLTADMYDLLKSSCLITDTREMPYPPSAISSDGTINW